LIPYPPMADLTQVQKQEIAERLLGTAESGIEIASEYGVDLSDIDAACSEQEVVRCEGCGWWCECHEMNEDDFCEDCRD